MSVDLEALLSKSEDPIDVMCRYVFYTYVVTFIVIVVACHIYAAEEQPKKLEVSREDSAMDMSLSEKERIRRAAFYKKRDELRATNRMVMDCPKCLIIFCDIILYRMHMSMHISIPSSDDFSLSPATWQCSMCRRQCSDRREFLSHTVKYAHSLIPQGLVVPPSISFQSGLPDLISLCQPTDLLKELASMVRKNPGPQ